MMKVKRKFIVARRSRRVDLVRQIRVTGVGAVTGVNVVVQTQKNDNSITISGLFLSRPFLQNNKRHGGLLLFDLYIFATLKTKIYQK